jgi:hypothetical protein
MPELVASKAAPNGKSKTFGYEGEVYIKIHPTLLMVLVLLLTHYLLYLLF